MTRGQNAKEEQLQKERDNLNLQTGPVTTVDVGGDQNQVDQNSNFHYMGKEQKESTIKKVGLMKRYLATHKDACFTIV